MRTIYRKTIKHNREVNVMRGFIEVMNQIREICNEHMCYDCPFCDNRRGVAPCYWQMIPEEFKPLEILELMQKEDKDD